MICDECAGFRNGTERHVKNGHLKRERTLTIPLVVLHIVQWNLFNLGQKKVS